MTTHDRFALFDAIIAALNDEPDSLVYSENDLIPPEAQLIGTLPRSTWGLRNLVLRMKNKLLRELEHQKKDLPATPESQFNCAKIKACMDLWIMVLNDELPGTQNYGALYVQGYEIFGAHPHPCPIEHPKYELIEKLRVLHATKRGELPPVGTEVPEGGKLVGETPAWLTALQTETVRISFEMEFRKNLHEALSGLMHIGVGERHGFSQSEEGKDFVIAAAKDGMLYRVPHSHHGPQGFMEALKKAFGGTGMTIVDLNKRRK